MKAHSLAILRLMFGKKTKNQAHSVAILKLMFDKKKI